MMRKSGDVSDAEMEVLQTLWKEGPATVREVSERLGPESSRWAYTTVQTLLGRLETKGFVTSDKSGVAHVFRAVRTREHFLSDRLADLADKVCGGMATPLMAALVDKHKFTKDELAAFRRLLDEAERPHGDRKNRPSR
jgi:predicted transcriptional regulator